MRQHASLTDCADRAKLLVRLLNEGVMEKIILTIFINPTEAEAIKLFSDTHLTVPATYFNELDAYFVIHGLDAQQLLEEVGLDSRVSLH